MRRIFLLALIALLAGVGVVAVIETDPGYVLVSYANYTLETSLWVGLLLLVLFTLAIYGVVRLIGKLVAGQHSVASWLGTRKARRSSRLTTRGLINFIEGNWSRARRQLLRGAKNNEAPLINYLMAARASYRLNEPDKMREYLGAAEASESEAGTAVTLTQAELKLRAGQYEQALAPLVRAKKNAGRHPYVLDLLQQAYRGLNDWDSLVALLPELRKHEVLREEELTGLERQAHIERLQQQRPLQPQTVLRCGQGLCRAAGGAGRARGGGQGHSARPQARVASRTGAPVWPGGEQQSTAATGPGRVLAGRA
jgi:HemY protein